MPWETLELDAETATSRDVSEAFTRKIGEARPGQDPHRSEKLRAAYEYALKYVEWRDRNRAAQPVQLSGDSSSPAGQTVMAVFEPLKKALVSASAEVPELARQAEQSLYQHPEEVSRWGGEMRRLLQQYGGNRDLSLTPEAMLFELQHSGFQATLGVIDRLDQQGRANSIRNLGELLLEHRERIATAGGATAALRLACASAIWERTLLPDLKEFAGPLLTTAQLQGFLIEVERCEKIGHVLEGVPEEWRLFWRERLDSSKPAKGWSDEESRNALRALASPEAQRWPSLKVLRDSLPSELATGVKLPTVLPTRLKRPSTPAASGRSLADAGGIGSLPQKQRRARRRSSRVSSYDSARKKKAWTMFLFSVWWIVYAALRAYRIMVKGY